MQGMNVFWPVYKNLEQEVLNLAKYIIFNDDQLNVYSLAIADLIIRASIDVESISKELYYRIGGEKNVVDRDGNKRDLYFDTDCIEMLKDKWQIDKKRISLATPHFFFEKEAHKSFAPLHKANRRGDSGCKWKRAYQALKHDRINSLKKATIENLISVMGALYILNVYYKEETLSLTETDVFDNRLGSEIFSVAYSKQSGFSFSLEMDDKNINFPEGNDIAESIYIITYDFASIKSIHANYIKDVQESIQRFCHSSEIMAYLKEHPQEKPISMNEICMKAGGVEFLKRFMAFHNTGRAIMSAKYEAKLNTNEPIHPKISLNDLSQQQLVDFLKAYENFNQYQKQINH